MLAVAESAHAFPADLSIEATLSPRLPDDGVAGDARWGSRPMAEHRVMARVLLNRSHYRSRRHNDSQLLDQYAPCRGLMIEV